MLFAVYKRNTGEVVYRASGQSSSQFENNELACVMTIDNTVKGLTHYVDLTVNPPAIKAKEPFPAVANKTEIIADNKDEVIISRIPLGCTCTLDGEPVIITEELITFTAEHVGTYVFKFSMFPYLDGTITITGKEKDENTGS